MASIVDVGNDQNRTRPPRKTPASSQAMEPDLPPSSETKIDIKSIKHESTSSDRGYWNNRSCATSLGAFPCMPPFRIDKSAPQA